MMGYVAVSFKCPYLAISCPYLVIKRVAVVELGVNNGSGDGGSCFGIEVWTDTACVRFTKYLTTHIRLSYDNRQINLSTS